MLPGPEPGLVVPPGLLSGLAVPGLVVPGLLGFVPPGFEVPGLEPGLELPGFDPGFDIPGFEFGFDMPGLVPPFGDSPGLSDVPGALGGVFGVVPGVVVFGLAGFDPGVAEVGGAVVLPVGGAAVVPVGGVPGAA